MGNEVTLSTSGKKREGKSKVPAVRTILKKYWAELRVKREEEIQKYLKDLFDLYDTNCVETLNEMESQEYIRDLLEAIGLDDRLCKTLKPGSLNDESFLNDIGQIVLSELKYPNPKQITFQQLIKPNAEGFRKFLSIIIQLQANDMLDDIKKHYSMKDVIGSGGYSIVWKAIHNATGLPVAVKEIEKSKYSESAFKHLQREVLILKQIEHPSIIKLYEVFDSPAKIYLVMELANQDLISLLQTQEYYSEKRAKEIIAQVASALDYLHALGIAHRDLKPENILISYIEPYVVKLTDFGFAKNFQDSFLRTKVGTSFYLAPEIISSSNYTHATDIWSLGVVLYVLLSGTFPFFGDSLEEIVNNIMALNYDFDDDCWNKVSPKAKGLIARLLVANPEKRLTAKQVLEDEWFKEEADEDVMLSETKKKFKNYTKSL
eukprot:TRINITY_DN2274_c0_g1_i1.p1 TRINITY_DN2274_c0_g1~~TRINITY_DN2274_c0_g1_i1.p1  ORF type:complete len:432 (+),score=111.84 TRINITY_DN2274_c0_g1_i1:171-1466(+)